MLVSLTNYTSCLKAALEEDIGTGDVTSERIVPAGATLRGQFDVITIDDFRQLLVQKKIIASRNQLIPKSAHQRCNIFEILFRKVLVIPSIICGTSKSEPATSRLFALPPTPVHPRNEPHEDISVASPPDHWAGS
jgi:hypothetical protein